jgi:tetratricopeptide (TPR) repeat protein
VGALILLLLLQAPVSADEGYEAWMAEGDACHATWDYEAALEAWEKALEVAPDPSAVRLRLADVLNDIGQSNEAAAAAARAEGDEDRARALAEAAEQPFERARDLAVALREAWPDRPEGPYWYAVSLANLASSRSGPEKVGLAGEIDAATRRAIALDPCFAPAWAALGVATREVARVGWLVRGLARATLGGLPPASLEDAEGTLRAAVALDPTDPFAFYQLALTLEARDETAEAVSALERALALPDREERDRRDRRDAESRLRRLRGEVSRRGGTSP